VVILALMLYTVLESQGWDPFGFSTGGELGF